MAYHKRGERVKTFEAYLKAKWDMARRTA